MAAYSNLYIDQGTTFSAVIEVADVNGNVIDISSYQSRGRFRKSHNSSTYWDFNTSILNGGEKGEVEISLSPIETSALKSGKYVYDVEIYIGTSYVYRILEGNLEVNPSATSAIITTPPISKKDVLKIDQGSTFTVTINLVSGNGDALDLTNYDGVRSQFRASYSSISYYEFTCTIVGNPIDGRVQLSLTSDQTTQIKAGNYLYDVEIFFTDEQDVENVFRVMQGEIIVTPEITR